MEELIRLISQRENLTIPDKAKDDVLDDLLFLTFDLDTMVMGYSDAILERIDPGFELDGTIAEHLLAKLRVMDYLEPSDQSIKEQIELLLLSLIRIRDQLTKITIAGG
jgi:hypothetical protein